MIMQVIHDWNDRQAVETSAIRRAAPAHAKLLLIERIIPADAPRVRASVKTSVLIRQRQARLEVGDRHFRAADDRSS